MRIDYQATQYPSITALAKAFNMTESTLRRRLKNGDTIEHAITGYKQTSTERVAKLRQERASKGQTRREFYATDAETKALKALLGKLRKKL